MVRCAIELERALERFVRLDLPLETARVRYELAVALTDRRTELATAAVSSGLRTFEQLGAATDAARSRFAAPVPPFAAPVPPFAAPVPP